MELSVRRQRASESVAVVDGDGESQCACLPGATGGFRARLESASYSIRSHDPLFSLSLSLSTRHDSKCTVLVLYHFVLPSRGGRSACSMNGRTALVFPSF